MRSDTMERPTLAKKFVTMAMRSGVDATAQRSCSGIVEDDVAVQALGERVWIDGTRGLHDHLGLSGEVVERALNQYAAAVHDDESVGHALGLSEFVGRDQQGTPALALGGDEVADHLTTLGIDGRGRLVEHERARPSEERQGEQRSLLLATAQAAPRRPLTALEREQADQFVDVARRLVVRGGRRSTSRGVMGAQTPPRWRSAPVRTTTSRWSRVGLSPWRRTVPASGSRKPSTVSTRVVLPAPFGPSRVTTSP